MSKTPMYYSIYKQLQSEIQDGTYPVGTNLPTDKGLAERFGVSVITIKKAMELLSTDGYITRKPRKGTTVREANPTKLNAMDTSHRIFGLVLTNFTDFFGASILRSILSTAQSSTDFIVKMSYGDRELENQAIHDLVALGIQGLILLPTSSEYASPELLNLVAKNFPVVVIDRLMGELPLSTIKTDSVAASRAAVENLFANGHTRIGMLTSDASASTIDDRITGFITAHIDAQQPFSRQQIVSTIDSVVPNSKRAITDDIAVLKTFFKQNPDLTAVVTSEYNIALLATSALEALGKRVPEDVSIISFDAPAMNPYEPHPVRFTHIEQNEAEIGKQAVLLLKKQITTPSFFKKVNLPFKLINGNTVRQL
ncbi:LacI family DNA-binding transcriptional regulator [Lacticaseibacillus parakribbianus]|uniref:LacI family DNA-binding transcriptional regulator n=1 Tax=Lacticaseibacillus parakribbianus TaxID=2970927 RepID=UPI0021CB4DEE|nr:GntR family transcriptional regulator [Lacticaseibacillus parakribbianus]